MMTEIKIYRGNQIGGCITEIWTGSTRILIDFGEELPGSGNKEPFAFPWEEHPVDAVFFPITMATTLGASGRCRRRPRFT